MGAQIRNDLGDTGDAGGTATLILRVPAWRRLS